MRHSVPILCELDTMPDHGPRHPLSLWDHVMQVVAGVSPSLDVRWAAILHDIAKPRTRSNDSSGRPRFFHHEEVGAALACETLEDLRYPNALVSNVALLVGTHMQLHSYSSEWSDGAVRRLMLRLGPLLPRAIELARADARGHSLGGRSTGTPRFDELEARVRLLEQDGVLTVSSPLSGHDLMERYGRGPGPWIRAVKTALEREVIDGRLAPSDRESAWRIADDLVGE